MNDLFVVTKQGRPILNQGWILASGEKIVAIEIDMRSKNSQILVEFDGAGVPGLFIVSCENSSILEEHTEIIFPSYINWTVFSAHISQYTLRVCLVKNETHPMDN
jgi:hypothetical protein